jgi:hypothetical protein
LQVTVLIQTLLDRSAMFLFCSSTGLSSFKFKI